MGMLGDEIISSMVDSRACLGTSAGPNLVGIVDELDDKRLIMDESTIGSDGCSFSLVLSKSPDSTRPLAGAPGLTFLDLS